MKDLPLEKDFQRTVLKRLREIPDSYWVKINDRVTIGIPDIIGTIKGLFIAIELKTRSRITPIQAHTLRKISETGAQAFIVTPDNWKQVLTLLLKLSA